MESSVIAAIISVIGAGLLGGFGYSMQRLHVKIDGLEERIDKKIDEKIDGLEERIDKKIDEKIDGLEERFNVRIDGLNARIDRLEVRIDRLEVKVDNLAVELRSELNLLKLAVGKVEFTQAHHSTQLEQIMSYGERIGRLEQAVFGAET